MEGVMCVQEKAKSQGTVTLMRVGYVKYLI